MVDFWVYIFLEVFTGILLHITEKLYQELLADTILTWQSVNQLYKLQFRKQGKHEAFFPFK
jgi:hypothetical protein